VLYRVVAPSSRFPQKSQTEGCKHQHDADIRHQPFPESMPEEQQIQADDNGNHDHNDNHQIDIPMHLNHPLECVTGGGPLDCA
jgi:hypothetical protein